MSRVKLGTIQIQSGPVPENDSQSLFNPKEVSIDKNTPWQKSKIPSDTFEDADTSAKKDRSILYNGHAGLGKNE
jgi:hypothetical protein